MVWSPVLSCIDWAPQPEPLMPTELIKIFGLFDVNRDGVISKDEFKNGLKNPE
jgi:hypothetical protein